MTLKLAFANVRRSYKDFAIYFIALLVGVAVFYAFNSIEAQKGALALSESQGQMIEMLGTLINIVSVLITAIMVFLVVYANRFLIKRRNKEFGLYLLLGMQRSRLLALTAAETLMVGFASLAAGMALGIALSQVLVWATAFMFQANMNGAFTFLLAPDAALRTVGTFCLIFAFALLVNVGYLVRAKLIDLLNADRRNESLTLRSIPLSFVLFMVSCALIGLAYHLLVENGLLTANSGFWAATVLVCIGTLLFFYSLSGFLLRVVQLIKPLYYRGLNMFTLREVASRVNSTFVSMSIICMTLFLAITSVCGGIGICNAMSNGYRTGYDATVRTYYFADGPLKEGAGRDMNAGLAESAAEFGGVKWDSLVRESAQIDFYETDFTMGSFDELAQKPLSSYSSSIGPRYKDASVCAVKLSQYNRALQMEGKQPVTLQPDQVLVAYDMDMLHDYYAGIAASGGSATVFGKQLSIVPEVGGECVETTSTPTNSGMLVVNDEAVPASAHVCSSVLNLNYTDAAAEEQVSAALEAVYEAGDAGNENGWPVTMYETKQEVYDQGVGLTTVVSYLAIYIGFVLVVACAAILAIQQLTAASDNRKRYVLLSKLGATPRMLDGALFKQIAIAFSFPLALAVCHSVCAMTVVADVVQMFGHLEIGQVAAITAAVFLVVHCAYFALTFVQARGVVRSVIHE